MSFFGLTWGLRLHQHQMLMLLSSPYCCLILLLDFMFSILCNERVKYLHKEIIYGCQNPGGRRRRDLLVKQIQSNSISYLRNQLGKERNTKDAIRYNTAIAKSQEDSSFPANGLQTILNKANSKSKTNRKPQTESR